MHLGVWLRAEGNLKSAWSFVLGAILRPSDFRSSDITWVTAFHKMGLNAKRGLPLRCVQTRVRAHSPHSSRTRVSSADLVAGANSSTGHHGSRDRIIIPNESALSDPAPCVPHAMRSTRYSFGKATACSPLRRKAITRAESWVTDVRLFLVTLEFARRKFVWDYV